MSNTTRRFLMAAAGGKKSTYVDDVFSTYLYTGNNAEYRSIVNGVDNTKGGLVWFKGRNLSISNILSDSASGITKHLSSDTTAAQVSPTYPYISSLQNNGFLLRGGTSSGGNVSGRDYASWNFRKAEGFFDVVTYTGTGSTQSLTHDLGSIPGCIMVKRTDSTADWGVYHRGQNGGVDPEDYRLRLNSTTSQNNDTYWGDTAPTATHFTVGDAHSEVNQSGATYVAYIFAGGEEQGNASVQFSGSSGISGNGDYIEIPDSTDLEIGSSQFTMECWFYQLNDSGSGSGSHTLMAKWDSEGRKEFIFRITNSSGQKLQWISTTNGSTNAFITGNTTVTNNAWHHAAMTRDSGGTIRMFLDGVLQSSTLSQGSTYTGTHEFHIGANGTEDITQFMDGYISNVRFIKGQALYTSNFTPTTSPLTTTSQGATASNVKLLCCNDIGASAFTVSPSALKLVSYNHFCPRGSTLSPFAAATATDAGAVFGEEGDQNIIKCGSYTGNTTTKPEINLGFEPQWLLVKNTNLTTEQWFIFDSMRGIITDGTDYVLEPSRDVQEAGWDLIDLTPTGFKIKINDDKVNNNGGNYIYMALRRPDGYVGKPVEVGTDAFNVVYGNSSSTIPNFPSNFTVGMGIYKQPLTAYSWYLHTRLTGGKNLKTDSNSAQNAGIDADATFDANAGWGKFGYNTDKASWMWKRHAGFDVVTYTGNGTAGHQIPHSLSKTPEMIWCKLRGGTEDWFVYHKSLNGGSSPENYAAKLNLSNAEFDFDGAWNDTAPTSTNFTLGSDGGTNANNGAFLAMLFASVDGISSVGSYSPTSASTTVTCGFQPRFVVVKAATKNNNWAVADSLRGITAGNDPALVLDENWENDKYGGADWIDVSATGFTVNSAGGAGTADANSNGETYIYYAHA